MNRNALGVFACALAVVAVDRSRADCAGVVIRTNPVTAHEEKAFVSHDGQDYEIKWSEKIGSAWVNEYTLTNNSADDTCPSLAFDSTGATAVVWKSSGSTARIHYRARKQVAGSWIWQSAATAVSDGTRDATTPAVVFHEGTPWVGWKQAVTGGDAQIVGAYGVDGQEPWPLQFTSEVLMTLSDPGQALVDLSSENGTLWATWVASTTALKYSVEDDADQTWGPATSVMINGGDVAAAKAQARSAVLGL
jgi:hypothetical protein